LFNARWHVRMSILHARFRTTLFPDDLGVLDLAPGRINGHSKYQLHTLNSTWDENSLAFTGPSGMIRMISSLININFKSSDE
jgi:hypothetical protein